MRSVLVRSILGGVAALALAGCAHAQVQGRLQNPTFTSAPNTCPLGFGQNDGCTGADVNSSWTFMSAHGQHLGPYARQSGQTWVSDHPMLTNVAGEDYPVGPDSAYANSLITVDSGHVPPGCGWNTTGGPNNGVRVTCNTAGADVTIQGYKFKGVMLEIGANFTGCLRIMDNEFDNSDGTNYGNTFLVKFDGFQTSATCPGTDPFGRSYSVAFLRNKVDGGAETGAALCGTPTPGICYANPLRAVGDNHLTGDVYEGYNIYIGTRGRVWNGTAFQGNSKLFVGDVMDQACYGSYPITVTNLTWSGGTATATTASDISTWANGAVAGVVFSGFSPSGWNSGGSNPSSWALTVVDAHTFTFPVAANPGTVTTYGTSVSGGDHCEFTEELTGNNTTLAHMWQIGATIVVPTGMNPNDGSALLYISGGQNNGQTWTDTLVDANVLVGNASGGKGGASTYNSLIEASYQHYTTITLHRNWVDPSGVQVCWQLASSPTIGSTDFGSAAAGTANYSLTTGNEQPHSWTVPCS